MPPESWRNQFAEVGDTDNRISAIRSVIFDILPVAVLGETVDTDLRAEYQAVRDRFVANLGSLVGGEPALDMDSLFSVRDGRIIVVPYLTVKGNEVAYAINLRESLDNESVGYVLDPFPTTLVTSLKALRSTELINEMLEDPTVSYLGSSPNSRYR